MEKQIIKIIQITAGTFTDNDGTIQNVLYGLGDNGKVYIYSYHKEGWV